MKTDAHSFTVDEVLNAMDSLETASTFLSRRDLFKWKWIAIALDHALYSFCVSAVAMHEPFNVLRNKTSDDGHMFERPGQGGKQSKRVKIDDENPPYRIVWEPCDPPPEPPKDCEPAPQSIAERLEGDLIGFWTALARAQDPVLWMSRMSNTCALELSDDQMRSIFRLHEFVRNELVHFVPKTNTFAVKGIQDASKDIINAISFLVFKSFAVHSFKQDILDRAKKAIVRFSEYYEAEQAESTVPSKAALHPHPVAHTNRVKFPI